MSVFFVHDVSKGIVSPLDRKFRVRDIPPTEEIQQTHRIHEKTESNPDEYRDPSKAKQQAHYSHNALKRYQAQSTIANTDRYGKVRDIMSKPVLTIAKEKSLIEAWKIMEKYEIHHLVILDEHHKYCGMLSEKKMVPLLMRAERVSPNELSLASFCNEPVLSTHPDTSIGDLAPAFLEFGLDGIAVYEHQQIVGIITYSDILKVILKAHQLEADA